MKLLVTGATGFIGSHFLNVTVRGGHSVVALRRSPDSQPRIPLAQEPIWLEKSMMHIAAEDFTDCDVLVHLAATGIPPKHADWETCYQFNVFETLRLVRTALSAGVKRVVVTGTYAEYGRSALRFDYIPPNAPLEPIDAYAASKASASVTLCAMCRALGFELSYNRLFSVYGLGQFEGNFWPSLRKAALAGQDFRMTDGRQVRDFVEVERVADRLLYECARTDLMGGTPSVRNMASGKPQPLHEFAKFWWEHFSARGQLRVGELPPRVGEVSRYAASI